jgi:hypothetical protein
LKKITIGHIDNKFMGGLDHFADLEGVLENLDLRRVSGYNILSMVSPFIYSIIFTP